MDTVIIAKLDRLTRSVTDLAELLERFQTPRRIAGERGGVARHRNGGRPAGDQHHDSGLPVGAGSDRRTDAGRDEHKRAKGQRVVNLASDEAYAFAITIQDCYANLDQIRVYVLTDRQAKAKNFKPREVSGKTVKLEVMDIERLHRHWSEGKPRDELVVNFEEVSGGALPCVYVPGEAADYDYARRTSSATITIPLLYAMNRSGSPGACRGSFVDLRQLALRKERTLASRSTPPRYLSYTNRSASPGIHPSWMQIVNGGQTTASIYFSKKKNPEIDLRRVRVPAKIIALRSQDSTAEEALISDISRSANSQTSVKLSDLSANKPFHVQIENLALSTYWPDGIGRWFYERAAGSYNTMLLREGTTPARLRQLKESIPTSRRITKTDLAKYLNAWAQRPDSVSFGTQKNFERFMADLTNNNSEAPLSLPDVPAYKLMVAKAILFKKAHALVLPMFQQARANVAAYVVSLVANRLGQKFDLDKIWLRQDISAELKRQIQAWAADVNKILHDSAGGRMISEWAKKPECWEAIRGASYTDPVPGIPEVR